MRLAIVVATEIAGPAADHMTCATPIVAAFFPSLDDKLNSIIRKKRSAVAIQRRSQRPSYVCGCVTVAVFPDEIALSFHNVQIAL